MSAGEFFGGEAWRVRLLQPEDVPALQELIERCSDYYELVTGLPPGPSEAHSTFIALPERGGYDRKLDAGIFEPGGRMIGVLDVVRDHPAAGEWWIGLLLVEPAFRGRRIGRDVFERFAAWAAAQAARSVGLGVTEENVAAFRFWRGLGFEETATKPMRIGTRSTTVHVLRRALP